MSYKIGQLRKNNTTSYLTDLSWSATTVKTEGYAAKLFEDYAIRLSNNGNFNANNTYYLRFSIKRIPYNDPRFSATTYPMTKDSNDPREMVIKLELLREVLIKLLKIVSQLNLIFLELIQNISLLKLCLLLMRFILILDLFLVEQLMIIWGRRRVMMLRPTLTLEKMVMLRL